MDADSGPSVVSDSPDIIQTLQLELAQTNHEVMALTLELEQRVDERTAELRAAQDELQKTNSELLQLTLELEDRVAQRTAELATANASLRAEIARRQALEEELRILNAELEGRVQERTAELAAANKELEAFSYSVSHDLRAPLRAMDGFSRILLEDYSAELDPEAKRYLGIVRDNARQMGHLVDDLLAFSRLGRQGLKLQSIEPTRVAREVLGELQVDREGRRVEISVGELPACQADPALLKQVFVNLLSNALKFTRKREPAVIEIGSSNIADCRLPISDLHGESPQSAIANRKSAIYYVRDNGVGFDMRYADKLFGVFQRLHRADEYEGTGVGLAIVQRIIHRHGGQVWAEGEVEKGAAFYFTIG